MAPQKLTDCRGEQLGPGDVIRLPFDYMCGPGSPGIDVMVYDPRADECGLGIITVTGPKAGLTWHVLPLASQPKGTRGLDVDWLVENWDIWFVYGHADLTPIPISQVVVLKRQCYGIVPTEEQNQQRNC